MFDPKAEAMSPDERAALQRHRLWGLVDRLIAAGGTQGARLKEAGVGGGADVHLADLRRLPFTTKRDLWDEYPFGMLAVPRDQVAAVHGSSGTRGRPTLVAYTRADLDLWAAMCARSLACAGAGPGSVVHNAYGYGLFTGGIGIHQGAVALGATVVPMSGGMTDRQIRMLADLRPDILACTPRTRCGWARPRRRPGWNCPPSGRGCSAPSPGRRSCAPRSSPSCRSRPSTSTGCRRSSAPASPPSAWSRTACTSTRTTSSSRPSIRRAASPWSRAFRGAGLHHAHQAGAAAAALPDGRHRGADPGECPCGRTLVRMSKVLGRADDMLIVRGVNVYPSEVERVLLGSGLVAPTTSSWSTGGAPTPASSSPARPSPATRGALARALRETLGLGADVRVLPPGTVPRVEVGKAVRVVTWDSGEPPLPGLG
ncbi:phenylacetate--CoA ligase family protein [Actinomadura yumaensis]|uniref:phenylacetate--CoA ligase family protein n=1 Tax=Actinomadura yumaensis TaxID=111807 RepID=UPI0036131679